LQEESHRLPRAHHLLPVESRPSLAEHRLLPAENLLLPLGENHPLQRERRPLKLENHP